MRTILLLLALTLLLGAAPAPAAAADARAADTAAAPVRFASAPPLLLDSNDLGFGATVVFGRVPSAGELSDLRELHLVPVPASK